MGWEWDGGEGGRVGLGWWGWGWEGWVGCDRGGWGEVVTLVKLVDACFNEGEVRQPTKEVTLHQPVQR